MELAKECDKSLFNTGMMADAKTDKFKVWPTQQDRSQFSDVISAGSKAELERLHPLIWRKYARKAEPRPRMVDAYLFFRSRMQEFFFGDGEEPPLANDLSLEVRAGEAFQALRNSLTVVVIDLDRDDDPQVIFETLNARGEPLLPADLLRNFIFFRANREKIDVEDAYAKYWMRFDEPFWRVEVKQGRLSRPRSDLFMQHFLSSRKGRDIPVKHLYVEYRHWIDREAPFNSVEDELATLARQGEHFRQIIQPKAGQATDRLSQFFEAYDIRTAYPLVLALLDSGLSDNDWYEVSTLLESYLLRRAICMPGQTKNYNRVFLSLTGKLRSTGMTVEGLRAQLLGQRGESVEWPDDVKFRESLMSRHLYQTLNNPKLVWMFARLNEKLMPAKAEALTFAQQPSIEHILPQSWVENWPLQDGSKGMTFMELRDAQDGDARAHATRNRNSALQTLGNLTLVSTSLNPALSNLGWTEKKPELLRHSMLALNLALVDEAGWDENSIIRRSARLADIILQLWPRD